jgi:hypothetical protein
MKTLMGIVIAGLISICLFGFKKYDNPAQQWVLLGEKKVNFLIDRDVIQVRGNTTYRQLKVKVKTGAVRVLDMNVHFENGDKIDVSIRQNIPAGGESRIIDLPGDGRNIKKIDFLYDTKGLKRHRASVQVWAKH